MPLGNHPAAIFILAMSKKQTPKPKSPVQKTVVPKAERTSTLNQSSAASTQPALKWLPYALMVGLAVVTYLAFKGGFQNTFVEWDDNVYIRTNPIIQNPSMGHIGKIFTTSLSLNYHPVTVFTLMLNAMIWGAESATSFIVTNVVLHILNVLLVFWFAARLSNKNWIVAAFVALLFGIHPMRVESVIWVSERKDVLYTFFFLLSCISYTQYQRYSQRKYFIYALVLFVLSCLSKAQAVVLPIVFLLLDYWDGRAWKSKSTLKEKLPFFIISLFIGFITMNVQGGGDFFGLIPSADFGSKAIDLSGFNLADRLKMGMYGFFMYIMRVFNPTNLSSMYPFVKFPDGSTPTEYLYGFFFFPISWILTYLSTNRTKLFAFGLGFYFITIVLVLQFISVGVAIMADRYSYLPYFGLFFMMLMAIHYLVANKPLLAYLAWTIVLGFATWCFYLTTQQVQVWKNTETLFSRRIEVQPGDMRALAVRGNWYGENGRIDEAIADLENAIKVGLVQSDTYEKLGTAYGMKGQVDKAISYFDKALEVDSKNMNALYGRAVGLQQKDPERAIRDLEILIKNATDKTSKANAMGMLGSCYINSQQLSKALETFNEVINQLGSKDPAHYYNRSVILLGTGNQDGAIRDLRKAIELNPNYDQAKQQLANLGVN